MKRSLLFFVTAILIIGCADDIIITPASDIRGFYKGTYESVTNYKEVNPNSKIQNVVWTFTDQRFYCDYDSSNIAREFCDFFGNYDLEDKLIFRDTVVDKQTCIHSDIPIGEFDLRRNDDSLIITQWDRTASTLKELRLVKQSE